MKFILGKKLDMTQVWQNDVCIPVTRVEAGPCPIIQIKSQEKDGYTSVQLGFGSKKEKNVSKPQVGHVAKAKKMNPAIKNHPLILREFRVSDLNGISVGDLVTVDTFSDADKIKVISRSKGRGFQGVVKRHGFKGAPQTHGNKDQLRMPGSSGATAPQRVFKGLRMGGHMGDERVTITNLEIVGVDGAKNILLVKGAIPGSRNSIVMIEGKGELKINKTA